MMGDEMAIRSGGMYGNPESQYTFAQPSSGGTSGFGGGGFSPIAVAGKLFNIGQNIAAINSQYATEELQANLNLQALKEEREYNVKNFEQYMADTLASNKMSFYSSGLDISSGSAQDVMLNNQRALNEDLVRMTHNYDIQERNIREGMKASKSKRTAESASAIASVASIF